MLCIVHERHEKTLTLYRSHAPALSSLVLRLFLLDMVMHL